MNEFKVFRRGALRAGRQVSAVLSVYGVLVVAAARIEHAHNMGLTAAFLASAVLGYWAVLAILGRTTVLTWLPMIAVIPLSLASVPAITQTGSLSLSMIAMGGFALVAIAGTVVIPGWRFIPVLIALVVVYLPCSWPPSQAGMAALVVALSWVIAFWVAVRAILELARRVDLSQQRTFASEQASAVADARESAQAQYRRVLHDTVIAGLMVVSMADRVNNDDMVTSSAQEALAGLEHGVEPWHEN